MGRLGALVACCGRDWAWCSWGRGMGLASRSSGSRKGGWVDGGVDMHVDVHSVLSVRVFRALGTSDLLDVVGHRVVFVLGVLGLGGRGGGGGARKDHVC